MLRSPVAVLLWLAAGCSAASDASPTQAVTVRDSAGVAIVENHHPMLAADAWQLTPEPILSLPDSVATGGLPYIRGARRLADGSILVAAGSAVRWLDRDGHLVRTIAGEGQGPGEFRDISELLLRGDTVILSGFSNQRKLSLFDPEGRLIREEPLDLDRFRALGRWGECQSLVLPDRSRIGCQYDPSIPLSATNRRNHVDEHGMSSPGPGLLRQLHRLYVTSPALDTAYALGIDIGIEQFGVDLGGGRETFITHPLHARTALASGGNPPRIAIATNPAWRVELWTTTGTLERVILLDHGRSATTPRMKTVGDSVMRLWELRNARDTIAAENALAQVSTPDSLPGVLSLAMDDQGFLAVTRGGLFVTGFAITIDFFDPAGRWLASADMPPRWRLLDFGEDYLLGVRYDEEDLPHLDLYGLTRKP